MSELNQVEIDQADVVLMSEFVSIGVSSVGKNQSASIVAVEPLSGLLIGKWLAEISNKIDLAAAVFSGFFADLPCYV